MKNMIVLDTALFVLAFAVGARFFAVMAHNSSLSLLSALPAEFQYLAGIIF